MKAPISQTTSQLISFILILPWAGEAKRGKYINGFLALVCEQQVQGCRHLAFGVLTKTNNGCVYRESRGNADAVHLSVCLSVGKPGEEHRTDELQMRTLFC